MNQTVTYLQELTAIPSPTGFTREIADYLVKTIEGFGYEVTRTAKGGVNVFLSFSWLICLTPPARWSAFPTAQACWKTANCPA